jgi:hypothetical protein
MIKIKTADEIVAEQSRKVPEPPDSPRADGDPLDGILVPAGTPGAVTYTAEPEHAAYIERTTPAANPPPPTTPRVAPEPIVRIKTADEIVAEYARTAAEVPADPVEHGRPMFGPPPIPARRSAPQAPQHQTTARTEVVALRQEVAALRQEQGETARLVREIHARIVQQGN